MLRSERQERRGPKRRGWGRREPEEVAILYHQAAGMMAVLHDEGFENRSYDPMASLSEFPR